MSEYILLFYVNVITYQWHNPNIGIAMGDSVLGKNISFSRCVTKPISSISYYSLMFSGLSKHGLPIEYHTHIAQGPMVGDTCQI